MVGCLRRGLISLLILAALTACHAEPAGDAPEPPLTDGCRSCHGSNLNAAPPHSLGGATEATDMSVGAHQRHLAGEQLGRGVSCTECHLVPARPDDPGHQDTPLPAELTFGPLARTAQLSPAWDRQTGTCANTYCHGATLHGGNVTIPIWNLVDGTQSKCGACHGMPPPAPHPARDACEQCHAPVAGPDWTLALPLRHGDGVLDVRDGCGSCHGTAESPAPPKDLMGMSDETRVTVGAHRTHLAGGFLSKPLACAECHLDPATVEAAGHTDTPPPAELIFGSIATAGGAAPAWDRSAETCANTYCHGGFTPRWTKTDGSQAPCGSCHGLPPPAPHPASERCELCHLPTAGPGKTIASRSTHVDGVVQVAIDGCTGCHGSSANLAPPGDLQQRADTSLRTVGAHQSHLMGGRSSRPVACDTCHLVPAQVDAPGHRDTGPPAELRFQGMAVSHGAQPVWNEAAASCASTYCHGATLSGGAHLEPVWTNAGGSEATCGACHGLPPPAPHPASQQCALCHAPTAGPGLTIADRSTHIDGVVQAQTGDCQSCHGGGGVSAPPKDTMMRTDPALPSVGAHRAHVEAPNGISRPVACNQCHVQPAALESPGHTDTPLPAELNFGPLASGGGALTPSYDFATSACSNTYCHGATLDDGAVQTPVWTVNDGSQSACGSCHGTPPAGAHPRDNRCDLCHAPTAGPNQTIADPTTHIDGVLQSATGCDSCHGENGVSAPPRDLDGASATNLLTIGAHRQHLAGGQASKPVSCAECHLVPEALESPGHTDTPRPAELVFGALAGQQHVPQWSAPTCRNTYCHAQGGAVEQPNWTVVDGTQGRCDSCHGNPPSTPVHQGVTACANCHLPTAGPGSTIANRSTHVDGVLQVTGLDCNTCHGGPSGSAPPQDTGMGTAPTDPEVGAHQAHLAGGQWSKAVVCTACHIVPATVDAPGHLDGVAPAEVRFSGLSSTQQTVPFYDPVNRTCADSYCHGGATSGGSATLPVWNQPASVPCGGCHGLPPAAPHPQLDRCELCHAPVAGPNQTIAVPARHLDGVEDLAVPSTCQSCHGTAANPAPPPDLSGSTNSAAVGAHRAHLNGTGRSRAVDCAECHLPVSPSNVGAAGHYDTPRPAELSFGALARQGGLRPTVSGAVCNNTYCHGGSLPGAAVPSPAWTDGSLSCTACHGMPPPDAEHNGVTADQCASCHPDTAGPNQTIANPARHVDGVVDTSASCDACHGQNGDPMPPRDLAGLSVSPQVGVHQAHRSPQHSAPVACTDCHRVPQAYSDPGHADTAQPAEVILAGRAALLGTNPSYAGAQRRCDNTYCHGATLTGGKTQVSWTDTDHSEAQCGACHGMPPATAAHSGQSATGCNSCHVDTAGPNATIIAPNLHLDGVVQVSGGGCDSCHGSPPAPGRESYAGSAGAHATHAGALGFECATCHGNNGAGPQHNEGNGTVTRGNVDLVFAATLSFPGGTTMRNGGTASYDQNARTCAVGCHNPIVGNPAETPALSNRPVWAANPVSCVGCHDSVQTTVPRNHNLTGLGDSGCLECHDQSRHTVQLTIRDPDPTDTYVWSAAQPDNLCRTCHDSGSTRAFGNQTPRNIMTPYAASSHAAQGYRCSECHSTHASTNGPLFVDPASTSCMASGCHANLAADFNQAPGGQPSHHHIEGGTGIQLSCSGCHNAHVSRAAPDAAVDPDNRWAIYSIPATAATQRRSSGDYRAFCLRCHDGTPPAGVQGALNIAAALSSGGDPSGFRRSASSSLHRSDHGSFNCQNCHDDHGSSGTLGIQRGRLLRNYLTINNFNATARTYGGESSCSTPRPIPGFGFGCH